MASKRSFYKSICIVDLISIAAFIGMLIYTSIESNGGTDPVGLIVFFSVSTACILGDILGLQLVNKFTHHQDMSKWFNRLLIFFYILSCVLLIAFGAGVYSIITELFRWERGRLHLSDADDKIGMELLVIMATSFLTSLGKVIFTLIVRKELKKNNREFLSSIDTMGTIDSINF